MYQQPSRRVEVPSIAAASELFRRYSMGLDPRVKCCPDGLVNDRRRYVKVLDCTIRDGGLCNSWKFDHDLVGRTFHALSEAGVDYMEVGYRSSEEAFSRAKVGPWRFCDEKDLEAVAARGTMKLSVMLDVGKVAPKDIPPASQTMISVVRIATYANQMDQALELLRHCRDAGYETFINVMAVSVVHPDVMDRYLEKLARSEVENVAVVDSFGSLLPHHVRFLFHKYRSYLGQDKKIGMHAHNNLQNGFANTVAAIEEGADFVDATIHGIGRGAGNCPIETLLFYLDNPKYNVRPILDLVEEFATLRDDLRWGYHLPYAISGYMNVHPQAAIQMMDTQQRYQCTPFYDRLLEEKVAGKEASAE